ncbi:MAG: YncE family protein [Odoribacteraceae bacterium]|jgi:DNA-binding beta-propeller fold protein YncE|nr:YncE family protein [Odoribacteraceae bacterium]
MKHHLLLPILLLLATAACRQDEPTPPSSSTTVAPGANGPVKGFFLLNEGNMGANKASIDYFDYASGTYTRDIYPGRNPGVVKELGDVGNDIQIHGNKLYAVINCSHFVEIMDLHTARHVARVSIPNCRYIAFKGDRAYVSSYAGPVQLDPNARLGYVARLDTARLDAGVLDTCVVGYQPEEMAITGNKLYVANSGGYRAPNYDQTISVIDLETFKVVKTITAGINLHRLELDNHGYLYASSRGNYRDVHSKTYVIDTRSDLVTAVLDLPNSDMTLRGDSLYIYSAEWSQLANRHAISYAILDTRSRQVVSRSFITDGTDKLIQTPSCLAVHPVTGEILVADARDYITPGALYCFSPGGKLNWKVPVSTESSAVTTGDIPSRIVFTRVALEPLDTFQ